MSRYRSSCVMAASVLALTASAAHADVFNMGDGLTSLEFVAVGNSGNTGELSGDGVGPGGNGPDAIVGAVDYVYAIGKYEVTAGQYTAFLNAVAATDTYGLYATEMWSSTYGCKIERSGAPGSYTYSVAADRANRPVNYVSWGDAARFMNWLHNRQVAGAQGLGTTEDGAYYLNGATSSEALMAVTRRADATYWIPTENEWYKAAYHENDGVTGNYWDFPTSSDTIDTSMANYENVIGHATDVGAYAYASPYGTFDQGGNVWEFNETVMPAFTRSLRGGYWSGDEWCLLASYRNDIEPALEHRLRGFRVASVPELRSICLFSFYNNSSWDDGSGAVDDDAIAADKVVLRPGLKATLANYTSYDKGINGLMIDVDDLPGGPTLNDFLFRYGNDDEPYGDDLDDPADDWPWAPDPMTIAVRPGAGQDGADRVTLIWEDGVIRNCWLQVTVMATDATGLAENKVFYVGNAVGESGNSTTDALVNATDEIGARNNPHSPFNPAHIEDPYDFNRDKLVNATDQIIARNNRTSPFTALKLITPPLEPVGGGGEGEGK